MTVMKLELGLFLACCYLVYDTKGNAAVIDPGDSPERVLAVLREKGLTLKAVLLTHGHFDHVCGVNRLVEACPAPVYAGEGEAPMLESPLPPFPGMSSPDPRPVKADRFLKDGEELKVGGLRFRVIAAPGHTPGGVCFLCGGTLFSGDTLFAGGIGRTDLPGGDFLALAGSLKRLEALPGNPKVYPGHGESTTLERERSQNPYLGRADDDFIS